MELRHGALALDLPSDWLDQSTLLFMRPPQSLSRAPNQTVPTEVVTVTFERTTSSPKKTLRRHVEQLQRLHPEFDRLEEKPFQCGLGDAWSVTLQLAVEGQPVRQLVVASRAGDVMVIATAASSVERFARYQEELRSILASIRAVSPS